MKYVINDLNETRRAVQLFRRRIADLADDCRVMEWGFPNGDRIHHDTYLLSTSRGQLQVGLPDSWGNRIPHLFRFAKENGPPSPDVELNIPTELNRSASGIYVRSKNSIWLGTRGHFTAFRGKIPREVTFEHFRKWLVEVDDDGRNSTVIPITSVTAESLVEDLAEFVHSVSDLKQSFKNSAVFKTLDTPGSREWFGGEEFEGVKSPSGGAVEEYEYAHGPLCNGLMRSLKTCIGGRRDLLVLRNQNIDAAIVDSKSKRARFIFEVKTSADFRSQIYSAIGQLLVYKQKHGDSGCFLALVLPSGCLKDAATLESILSPLNIGVLFGDGPRFVTSSGGTLSEFIETRWKL